MDKTDISSPLCLTRRLRQHLSDRATLYTLCCIVAIGIALRLFYISQPMIRSPVASLHRVSGICSKS